ncbi:MAG: 4-(cytidine 5'-diphospho)-2-C-methyl-D-erythritol kinase [Bacteroidia bacterium]|nr:4-(cytidine 5'-diphospho)-2-C-methyl-D-erythritol kinase [Bacteroidia bacterium]
MLALAGCKINIGLQVVNKRADGYHNIETVMYPVPWYDVVEINEAAQLPNQLFSFTQNVACVISGLAFNGNITDNLCYKAYQLLAKNYSLPPVVIHLHKCLPNGAGLGGGSSDGAQTLMLLNKLFALKLSNIELKQYAAKLGSDCRFFIDNLPALATEKGEILKPINLALTGMHITLIKPDVSVNTAKAYAQITPGGSANLFHHINNPINTWQKHISNDFEIYAMKQYPIIAEIKTQLYKAGCVYASMSGSGSCVYGISSKPIEISIENTIQFSSILK